MRPARPARCLLLALLAVGVTTSIGGAQTSRDGSAAGSGRRALAATKPFARKGGSAGLRSVVARRPESGTTVVDRDSLVSITRNLLGVRYVWAGASPKGVDCSGLVQYAFSKLGLRLPHSAAALANTGEPITPDTATMRPGDLIVFSAERSTRISHVGIYVGGGAMVHASTSKRRVIEVPFNTQRGLRVRGVRRVLALADTSVDTDRF